MSDSGCKFIQLSLVKSISNEILVQKPCQFKLNFKDYSVSFACYSSIDYTEWMNALNNCLESNNSLYNFRQDSSIQGLDKSDESDEDESGLVRIASHLTFSS